MRRLLGGLLVVLLLSAIPALTAGGSTQSYEDDFEEGGYSGNDGTLDFDGPWIESGENDGPSAGRVQVDGSGCSGQCLLLDGENLVSVGSFGAQRAADLSMFSSAELRFHLEIDTGLLTDDLRVEVFDGSGWRVLETYPLDAGIDQSIVISVTEHVNADFAFRFVHPGGLGGLIGLLDTGSAFIDDVVLIGTVIDPTTTTTTTPTTTSTTKATTTTPGTTPGRPTTTTAPAGTPTGPTTTTTRPATETTDPAGTGGGDEQEETDETTTTTESGPVAGSSGGPPPPGSDVGPGLRDPGVGLIAGFQQGIAGNMQLGGLDVLGADVTVDFSMVVEFFEAARIWLGALALIMAMCLVAGMDRRRWRNLPGWRDVSIVSRNAVAAHAGGAEGEGWPQVETPPA